MTTGSADLGQAIMPVAEPARPDTARTSRQDRHYETINTHDSYSNRDDGHLSSLRKDRSDFRDLLEKRINREESAPEQQAETAQANETAPKKKAKSDKQAVSQDQSKSASDQSDKKTAEQAAAQAQTQSVTKDQTGKIAESAKSNPTSDQAVKAVSADENKNTQNKNQNAAVNTENAQNSAAADKTGHPKPNAQALTPHHQGGPVENPKQTAQQSTAQQTKTAGPDQADQKAQDPKGVSENPQAAKQGKNETAVNNVPTHNTQAAEQAVAKQQGDTSANRTPAQQQNQNADLTSQQQNQKGTNPQQTRAGQTLNATPEKQTTAESTQANRQENRAKANFETLLNRTENQHEAVAKSVSNQTQNTIDVSESTDNAQNISETAVSANPAQNGQNTPNTQQNNTVSQTNPFDTARMDRLDPGRQVVEHVRMNVRGADQEIQIRLNPAELGSVHIRFKHADGEITGLVQVEKAQTRYEIEKALPQIAASLQEAGVNVRRIEVTMNTNNQQQNQSGSQSDNASEFDLDREFKDLWQQDPDSGYQDPEGEGANPNRRGTFTGSDNASDPYNADLTSDTGLNFYI